MSAAVLLMIAAYALVLAGVLAGFAFDRPTLGRWLCVAALVASIGAMTLAGAE